MKVYCYRYMWTLKGSDKAYFKIFTDTEEGHELFKKGFNKVENLDKVGFEYVCEYDCSRLGVFEALSII